MLLDLALLMAATATALAPTPPMIDTPVLARTIEKGEALLMADFTTAAMPPATARGATQPSDAAGKEATRRLAAGNPVRANDVAVPRVIRRGEAVTIALISGPLRITSAGRALSDGAVGEPVRVINLSTNRTLDAVADKAGRVRVMAQ